MVREVPLQFNTTQHNTAQHDMTQHFNTQSLGPELGRPKHNGHAHPMRESIMQKDLCVITSHSIVDLHVRVSGTCLSHATATAGETVPCQTASGILGHSIMATVCSSKNRNTYFVCRGATIWDATCRAASESNTLCSGGGLRGSTAKYCSAGFEGREPRYKGPPLEAWLCGSSKGKHHLGDCTQPQTGSHQC